MPRYRIRTKKIRSVRKVGDIQGWCYKMLSRGKNDGRLI
jgi:hypothetical protein